MRELKEMPYEEWQDTSPRYEAPELSSSVPGFCPTCKQHTSFIILRGEIHDKNDGFAVIACPLCEDAFYLKFVSVVPK